MHDMQSLDDVHRTASAQNGSDPATENNCSICSLFLEACLKIVDLENFDHVSAWTGRGGLFGLCLGKDGLESIDDRTGGSTIRGQLVSCFRRKYVFLGWPLCNPPN